MSKFYNQESIVKHNREQARVYTELIEGFKTIIPALEKFDGKVINVRLEKAIKELLDKEHFAVSIKNGYNNNKHLKLWNHKRSYSAGEYSCNYVDYCSAYIEIDMGRLNSKNAITELEKECKSLEKQANELLTACNNIADIEKEYKQICDMIRDFNNKVPYQIRESYKFDRVY